MKRIILLFVILFAGFNQYSQAQCTSAGSFGFLTSAQTLCGSDIFSRRIYIEDDGSGTWNIVTTVIEVEIDWGDGTAPIVYNIPYNAGFGAWTTLATHTAPDGAAHTACTYEATAILYVDGVDCSAILGGGAIQTLNIIVWDEIDNTNLGTHDTDLSPNTTTGGVNGNIIEVCEGDTQDVVIMDNSDFNCSTVEPDPLNWNLPRRWIQFVYGTGGSNITGTVLIDGNPEVLPYYGDIQLVPFGAPVAANEDALPINFPATSIAGEIFEVTLRSWNACNPYDDNLVDGELNPAGGIFSVGNAFADAIEIPIEITQIIEIIDKPNSPTPNNELICLSDAVPDVSITPTAGATSIIWYDADPTAGAAGVLQNSAAATYTTGESSAAANQYSYWVTQINAGDNNCESDPVEVTLTVREQLSIDPIDFDSDPGATEVCTGTSGLVFSVPNPPGAEIFGGATEYEWEIIMGGGISIVGPTNGQSIKVDITNGTTGIRRMRLWRRYTTTPLCPEFVFYDIDIFPSTVPGNISGGTDICEGASTPLLTLTGYTGNILRWERSYNAGAFVDIGNAGNNTFSELLSIDGSYEYRAVVQSGGGCTIENSLTTIVNVFDVPVTPSAGTDQDLCGLLTYGLLGSNPGIYTGQWSVVTNPSVNPPVFSDATSEVSNVAILAGDEGIYEFQWAVTNGPCTTSDIVQINFREAPTVSNAGSNDTVCGTTYTMSGNSITVGVGTWSVLGFPSGGGVSFDNTNNPITNITLNTPLTYGVYTLQWESVNGITSCNSTSTVDITFNQGAEANASGNLEFCMDMAAPTNVNLNGTVSGISTSGRWEVVSGNGVIQSSGTANGSTFAGAPPFALNDTYIPDATDVATVVELRLRADSPNASCPDEYSLIELTINEEIGVDATTNGTFNTPTEICQSAGTLSTVAIYGSLSGGRHGATGTASLSGHWEVVAGAGTMLNGSSINGAVINDGYTPGVLDLGTTVTLQLVGEDPDGASICTQILNQIDIFVNEAITANATTDGSNNTPTEVCVNTSLTAFDVYGTLSGGVLGASSTAVQSGHWEVISGDGVLNSNATTIGSTIVSSTIIDQYVPAVTDLGTTITLRLVADDPDIAGPCGGDFDEINIEINEELIPNASTNGVDITPTVVCVNPIILSSFSVFGRVEGGRLGNSGVPVRNGRWEVITGNGTMTSTNSSIGSSITGTIINDAYRPVVSDLGTTIELHLVAEDNDTGSGPCGDVIDIAFVEINELLVADATNDGVDTTPTAVCINASSITSFSVFGGIAGGRLGIDGSANLNGHWEVLIGNGMMTSSNASIGNTIAGSNSIIDAYLPDVTDVGTTVRLQLIAEDPDGGGPCNSDVSEINIQINEEGFVTANQTLIQIAAGSSVIGGLAVDELGVVLSGSGSSGQWSVVSAPNEGVISNINAFTPNFTPSVNQEIIGSVTLQYDMDDTDGAGPCSEKSVQIVISIGQNPTADAGVLNDICEDEIVNLIGTIGGSATTGSWSVSGGVGILSSSTTIGSTVTATYTPDAADTGNTITFTLTTDDPDGAGPVTFTSDDVLLNVNPLPVITGVDGDLNACVDNTAHPYFVQGANPALSTFSWDLSSLGTEGTDYELTAGGDPLHFVIIKYSVPQTNRAISVTETIIATGCNASFNITGINIYEYPSIALESSDVDLLICDGEEVTFTANPISGIDASTNYEFKVNGLTVQSGVSNTYTTISLQTGSGVTVTVSNGGTFCDVTEGPIVHIVNSKPVANDQSIEICSDIPGTQQTNVNLTLLEVAIDGGAGNTITWYDNASLTPPITTPSNYQVINGDILYAEVDAGGGCTNVAQVDYTVNSSPEISVVLSSDYNGYGVSCFGATDGQLTTAITASGTAPYMYSINGGVTYQSSSVFDNLGAGTYTIIVQDDNNCTYTSGIVVIIDPLPLSAGIVSGGGIICEGDDLQEIVELSNAFGGIGNYDYQWQYSYDKLTWLDDIGALGQNYVPNQSIIEDVTYFRRRVNSGSCDEQYSNIIELKINELPTGTFEYLSIDGSSVISEICENEPFLIQFQFTGTEPFFFDYSDGNATYENQFGAATMIVPVSDGISENLTVNLSKVRDLNNCEAVFDISKTLNVIRINAEFNAVPDVSCSGADVVLSFNVDADVAYTFNFGDGNSNVIAANSLPVGENAISHTYVNGSPSTTFSFNPFLIAEKVNGTHCGPVQTFETITIYPSVLTNVFTPTSEICSGELVSFNNQTLGAVNHEWYYRRQGVNEQIDFKTTKQADFTFINDGSNNPQVYEIVYRGYTDNNDGNVCESTQIIPVNVYKNVIPDFSFTPTNPVIKNGATPITITNLSDPIDESNFIYNWEFGDGMVVVDDASPDGISYSQAGDKEVKLTVVNRLNASCQNTIYKTIPIEDIPISADFIIEPESGCTPLEIQIHNNTFGSADMFTWTIFKRNSEVVYESVVLSESGEPAPVSFSYTLYDPGFYSIELIAENSFTDQKDVIYKENALEVYPVPTTTFELRPYTIYLPDQQLQTFNYTNIEDANTWHWDFGDEKGTSTDFEPTYLYEEKGVYEVTLVASYEHEEGIVCSDTLRAEVNVEEGGVSRIPNAFTPSEHGPSGDGRIRNEVDNDIFLPITEGVLDDGFHMMIFDRWGNLLFESRDKSVGWDGYAHDGSSLPAGVYVYKLSLTLKTGERENIIGDISLIR